MPTALRERDVSHDTTVFAVSSATPLPDVRRLEFVTIYQGRIDMRITISVLAALVLAGCASSGVISTGPNTYMLTAKSAGGLFTNGNAVLANLYKEANAFCEQRGQVVETVDTNAQNAIPFARMPNAKLDFRCVPKAPQAAATSASSATQ